LALAGEVLGLRRGGRLLGTKTIREKKNPQKKKVCLPLGADNVLADLVQISGRFLGSRTEQKRSEKRLTGSWLSMTKRGKRPTCRKVLSHPKEKKSLEKTFCAKKEVLWTPALVRKGKKFYYRVRLLAKTTAVQNLTTWKEEKSSSRRKKGSVGGERKKSSRRPEYWSRRKKHAVALSKRIIFKMGSALFPLQGKERNFSISFSSFRKKASRFSGESLLGGGEKMLP